MGAAVVVQHVDLEIRTGEVVGLLGPNGAGKTTTFYMMVGLTRPDGGPGLPGRRGHHRAAHVPAGARGIGYLPQEATIFRKLTVEENVRAILETRGSAGGATRAGAPPARRARHRGHGEAAGVHALGWRAAAAGDRRALATSPSFMLLDEPFAGIDPLAVHEIQGIIGHLTERGIGILITDHNVRETLKITDRAYIIREGEVFRSGTPSELASDEEVRRVYLGESFRLDERGPGPRGVASLAIQQKLGLSQRLSQRLILTPSLQQAIKLLPLTTLELADVLEQEVMENPLLEEVPTPGERWPPTWSPRRGTQAGAERRRPVSDIEVTSSSRTTSTTGRPRTHNSEIPELPPIENTLTTTPDLYDHLTWQLHMSVSDELLLEIGDAIIGNLDEDGYLRASVDEIANMGPYPQAEVEKALALVQDLDPVGVAARDLTRVPADPAQAASAWRARRHDHGHATT